jgi:hypothetical protein
MEALQRKAGYTMAKKGYVLKFRTKLLLTLLFLSYFLFLLFQQSFEMQAQQALTRGKFPQPGNALSTIIQKGDKKSRNFIPQDYYFCPVDKNPSFQ